MICIHDLDVANLKRYYGMLMYDPKKRDEYKLRLCLSLAVSALIALVLWRKGIAGPAFWELLLLGFGFCFFSIIHSTWALIQISKQRKDGNVKN